ncbi:Zeta toxin [Symmachiella dynata]|uniref:Zeta toxin n=1 Tax=Symmachiella dynata TaxID=2527995 RepID=A0A517ZMN0_9PLAN|nr:zeta toxin family protein [Symmachiella dynata]QDU43736.1 Zeta toxin [Symmachiella dynata]
MTSAPNVIVVAGPNGAGKSTAAPALLRDYMEVTEFVNADVIAQGLSAFHSEGVAIEAGRVMLRRLDELTRERRDFAFETTLASRSLKRRLMQLSRDGYRIHLIFLWLPTPEMAIARVLSRVQQGGHDIPEETIRRRYFSGLNNFMNLYLPIVDSWTMLDNTLLNKPALIAFQNPHGPTVIKNETVWNYLVERFQS